MRSRSLRRNGRCTERGRWWLRRRAPRRSARKAVRLDDLHDLATPSLHARPPLLKHEHVAQQNPAMPTLREVMRGNRPSSRSLTTNGRERPSRSAASAGLRTTSDATKVTECPSASSPADACRICRSDSLSPTIEPSRIRTISTAADLISEARNRAQLTHDELAKLAGTSRPTVSAYESGAKNPRADTLGRLLEATGFRLVTRARPTWTVVGSGRKSAYVPSALPELSNDAALAEVTLGVTSHGAASERSNSRIDTIVSAPTKSCFAKADRRTSSATSTARCS